MLEYDAWPDNSCQNHCDVSLQILLQLLLAGWGDMLIAVPSRFGLLCCRPFALQLLPLRDYRKGFTIMALE